MEVSLYSNFMRVLRGGSLSDHPGYCRSSRRCIINAGYCRSSRRRIINAAYRDFYIGFRTVCAPKPASDKVSAQTEFNPYQGGWHKYPPDQCAVLGSGETRVVRSSPFNNCRSAFRAYGYSGNCGGVRSFRTVRVIPTPEEKEVQGLKDVPSDKDVEVTFISLGERTWDSALREANLSKVPQSGKKGVLAKLVFTRLFSGASYEEAFSKAILWMNTMAESSGVEITVRKTK